MSKRTIFTTVTPLPAGISRETVMETLRNHCEMIDLNPLVEERHPIKPPSTASPEEFHCQWYSLTDRVQYLPGGMASGKVTYSACFHDLANGLQTHIYAPLGLNIKGKWILGGSLPGEPIAPVELGVGAPLTGLWLREDVDMKCNFMLTSFVKGNLKKSHSTLVSRMLAKARNHEALKEKEWEEAASGRGSDLPPRNQYGEASFSDRSRVESWAARTAHASQVDDLASPQSSVFGDDDSSLRPRPLSILSNSTTLSGSASGYQQGWQSRQNETEPDSSRVSWQTLSQSAQGASIQQQSHSSLPVAPQVGRESWQPQSNQQQTQRPLQNQRSEDYARQQQQQQQQQSVAQHHQRQFSGYDQGVSQRQQQVQQQRFPEQRQSPPPVELPSSEHQERRQVYEMG